MTSGFVQNTVNSKCKILLIATFSSRAVLILLGKDVPVVFFLN